MPEKTSYDQGWISWVDLSTSNVDGAKAFYTGLFGWEYDEQVTPTGTVYSMAQIRGKNVAAIAPQRTL